MQAHYSPLLSFCFFIPLSFLFSFFFTLYTYSGLRGVRLPTTTVCYFELTLPHIPKRPEQGMTTISYAHLPNEAVSIVYAMFEEPRRFSSFTKMLLYDCITILTFQKMYGSVILTSV